MPTVSPALATLLCGAQLELEDEQQGHLGSRHGFLDDWGPRVSPDSGQQPLGPASGVCRQTVQYLWSIDVFHVKKGEERYVE